MAPLPSTLSFGTLYEPGTTKPGTTKPGTTKPGTTKPGTTKTGTTFFEYAQGQNDQAWNDLEFIVKFFSL
jgi:hypothetical protein